MTKQWQNAFSGGGWEKCKINDATENNYRCERQRERRERKHTNRENWATNGITHLFECQTKLNAENGREKKNKINTEYSARRKTDCTELRDMSKRVSERTERMNKRVREHTAFSHTSTIAQAHTQRERERTRTNRSGNF